jgi:hypothetical protein
VTCRQCKGKCRSELPPGKWCPTCGKLLALGAWCPKHGDPLLLPDAFHKPPRPRKPSATSEAEAEAERQRRKAERDAEWERSEAERKARWERFATQWKAESERRFEAEAERWARYRRAPDSDWARTLGFTEAPTNVTTIKSAFRRLALRHHPDHGGEAAAFIKVKAAYDAGLAAIGGRS